MASTAFVPTVYSPWGIMTDVKHEQATKQREGGVEYNSLHDKSAQGNPVRRRGEAQDIANAVLYLVSELAGFVSGANLTVDGGMGVEIPTSVASRL